MAGEEQLPALPAVANRVRVVKKLMEVQSKDVAQQLVI